MNPSLVISYPKGFRAGAVVSQPVELLDILKTSLDIAGAPVEDRRRPHGFSLLPLLTGEGETGPVLAAGGNAVKTPPGR